MEGGGIPPNGKSVGSCYTKIPIGYPLQCSVVNSAAN